MIFKTHIRTKKKTLESRNNALTEDASARIVLTATKNVQTIPRTPRFGHCH
jgi:hypothetical protein